MQRTWSFGQKIALSFAAIAALAIAITGASVLTLRSVTAAKDRVISVNAARLLDVASMRVARERRAKHVRSYLLTRDERFLGEMRTARDELLEHLRAMKASPLGHEEEAIVDRIARTNIDLQAAWDRAIEMRRAGTHLEEVVPAFEKGSALVKALDEHMNALHDFEGALLAQRQAEAEETSKSAVWILIASSGLASGLAGLLAWALSRGLGNQIRRAIQRLQGSSMELQSAAKQQAMSSKELTSTTVEIASTTRELLATSHQIMSSARQASAVVEEAGESARDGDFTVRRAQEALGLIKRQVDMIVEHMLELGKKSQQIGGILDVINEHAEQTNILAINATIESVAAGESGKRFAVVAAEIRRLSDRVAGSAREVRTLVEEIRGAANATVMATEDGSKAVDAGTARFGDVLSTFKRIVDRVSTTAEVAREIELSIHQQTTAVEQVSSAIAEVAAAARESEASTGMTLQLSSQLAGVSTQLASVIRASTAS